MGKYKISTTFAAIDKMTAPVRKMQKGISRMTVSAENGLRKLDNAFSGINSTIASGVTSAAKLTSALTGGALAATAVINKQQQEIVNLSDAVGANIKTVEAVSSAVADIGLNTDNVIDLYEEMNNKLGESKGLEEITAVTESLSILGLRFKDIKKLAPEEQFKTITNAVLKMEDATKAQAAADILMGGEANKVFGALRKQAGSMEEVIALQDKLSFRTDRSRRGATAMARAQSTLAKISKSLGQEIAGLAGKHLAPLIDKMNAFLVANKGVIGQSIDEFFAKIAANVGDVSQMFDKALGGLKGLSDGFQTFLSWAPVVAKMTAALIGVSLAIKAATLATTLLNAAMALNPAVWVIAGIGAAVAAIGYAFYKVYENFDRVTAAAKGAWAVITGLFDNFNPLERVKQSWDGLGLYFDDLFSGIASTFDNTIGRVMSGVESVASALGITSKTEVNNDVYNNVHSDGMVTPYQKQVMANQQVYGSAELNVNVRGTGGAVPEQSRYTSRLQLATSGG